jgi:hypothetical protein
MHGKDHSTSYLNTYPSVYTTALDSSTPAYLLTQHLRTVSRYIRPLEAAIPATENYQFGRDPTHLLVRKLPLQFTRLYLYLAAPWRYVPWWGSAWLDRPGAFLE